MGEQKNPLRYLEQYDSQGTVNVYKNALKNFFEMIYETRTPLMSLAEKYCSEQRNHQEDVEDYLVNMKEYAPKTTRRNLSAIKTFLLENDIELSQRFWRRLRGRIKGSRALTIDKVPSNLELRKTMLHLPIQGKALFLALSSSGMRMGETLRLKREDLDLETEPCKITIQGEYTKTGNSRITFISRETKEAVIEWLKVRDNYLEAASARSRYDKEKEDLRLFPFTGSNARVMWNNALAKAGNGKRDQQTNIHKMHPHVLRKYFRTKLGAVIPVDVVEALMGHEGYLTEVYRRYSMEDLAKFYKQGEHALLVFTEAEEVGKLRKEVEEQKDHLQAIVNGLTAKNLRQEGEIEQLKAKMLRIERILEEFQKKMQV